MTHFALVTVDGDTLGVHEFNGIEWPAGSIVYGDGGEPDLRVVGRLEPPDEDPEKFDVLVVEPSVRKLREPSG